MIFYFLYFPNTELYKQFDLVNQIEILFGHCKAKIICLNCMIKYIYTIIKNVIMINLLTFYTKTWLYYYTIHMIIWYHMLWISVNRSSYYNTNI